MTRDEIKSSYDVDEDGLIASLGKFENEQIYAPHFYELANDGEILSTMDDGENFVSLIQIDNEDRLEFPELEDDKYVLLVESSSGFVICSTIRDEVEADAIRAQFTKEKDDSNDGPRLD